MNIFLKIIANQIYKKHKNIFDEICIVFPNNRASLFFNKYLTEIASTEIWKPKYTTINNFIYEITDFNLADDLSLVFNLYKIYKKIMKSNESFDSFYFWGKMILNDFNDIDKNNLNAKDIYANLRDIKEIENIFDILNDNQKSAIKHFWHNFEQNKDSEQKKQFKSIWENLYKIYTEFNNIIKQKNEVYEGVIYKDVYNKILNYNINTNYKKIIFIGLNALNNTEFKLLEYLQKQKITEFYWDIDKYYIDNKLFEAGNFIRKNAKILKPEIAFNNKIFDNFDKQKNINIYSVSSNTGQTKILSDIITKLSKQNNFNEEQTAVILANEELLIPVINSIPEFIKNINVTMGYPIKNTQSFGLINNIIKLWKETKYNNNESNFYYKNVLSVIHHNLLQNITDFNTDKFEEQLISQKKIYITPKDINTKSELLKNIFQDQINLSKTIENLIAIISEIINLTDNNQNETTSKIETEVLFSIYLNLNRLNDIIKTEKIKFKNFKTYENLIQNILSSISVPFEGEPLKGLQIMGILETRAIDFKNIIILSLNEGTLPKVSVASSFIPYNLRRGFNLPTIENQDSIFSYYFYRLIQRAKNISLVYNAEQTYTNTGEASRFIKQLQYESGKKINFINVENNIALNAKNKITIKKNQAIINILDKYFTNPKKYISPSAINTYIDCSLKFYFRYIAKIKEPDEITENIDSALFGTIFHKAMELTYKPFLNKIVNQNDIEKIINKETYIKHINQAFNDEKIKLEKQVIITYEIIKENILQALKKDKTYTPFKILYLEKDFKTQLNINFNNTTKKITVKGNIDRVDKINNKTRIIDYKTGKAEQKINEISNMFNPLIDKRPKAIMQTMIYAMAYKSETNNNNLYPCIYQIKELHSNKFYYELFFNKKILQYDDIEDNFKTELTKTINKIFDTKQNFSQTDNQNHCKYCEYKKICY